MITKPTLIIDKKRCQRNIDKMQAKAQQAGLTFRPHFKTHQLLEVGQWFKEKGIAQITVSSLDMAQYFAQEWSDITVAFPTNILEIATINDLAKRIQLNILVESVEVAAYLSKEVKHPIGVFIKVDVGYHRTGVAIENTVALDAIIKVLESSNQLQFKGFLTHAGHTYKCRSVLEIEAIHQTSLVKIQALRAHYLPYFPDIIISYGDTPSCSVATDFEGIDEIRPGNFIYYDLTQVAIGSCRKAEIAVAVACPIVALHEDRQEMVIYGGGVHLSKDRLELSNTEIIFGQIAIQNGSGWSQPIEGMYLKSLSQEHGIVHLPQTQLGRYKVGDCVMVLPIHSCMAADLLRHGGNWKVL